MLCFLAVAFCGGKTLVLWFLRCAWFLFGLLRYWVYLVGAIVTEALLGHFLLLTKGFVPDFFVSKRPLFSVLFRLAVTFRMHGVGYMADIL